MKKYNGIILAVGAIAIVYFLANKKGKKGTVIVSDAQKITEQDYDRAIQQDKFGVLTDAAKNVIDIFKGIKEKRQERKRDIEEPWYGQQQKKAPKKTKKSKVSGINILF